MVAYVQVPVPEHLVPAVMTLITENTPPPTKTAPDPKVWTPKELTQLWAQSGKPIREFLIALSAVPDTWVPTSSLIKVAKHNTTTNKFAGMMGAFGRRLKNRHSGRLPFERKWDHKDREYQYRMTVEIATIIAALDGEIVYIAD